MPNSKHWLTRSTFLALLSYTLLFAIPRSVEAHRCPQLLGQLERNRQVIANSSFTTTRDYNDYQSAFGVGFTRILEKADKSEQPFNWIDLGAGNANAMREVLGGRTPISPTKIKGTAIGYEAPKDDDFNTEMKEINLKLGPRRFQYLSGRYFNEIPQPELGKADLITDYFGVMSYTHEPSQDLARALRLLRPGGVYMMVYTHSGFDFESSDGKKITLEDYLGKISGVKIVGPRPLRYSTSVIEIQRTDGPLQVPELELVNFTSSAPPDRLLRIVSGKSAAPKKISEKEMKALRAKFLGQ